MARDEHIFSAGRAPLLGDLKLLSDHHDQLRRARNQAANRTHKDLVILQPGYQQRVPNLTAKKNMVAALRMIQGDHSVRAELIRSRIRELRRLDAELAELRHRIRARSRSRAPH